MKNVSIFALKMIKTHTHIKADILLLSPTPPAVRFYAGIQRKLFNVDLQNSIPLCLSLGIIVLTRGIRENSRPRRPPLKVSLHPMNVRQGKSFQWCTHFLYCSVLSLGSNINTRVGVSQPDMGSIFQIKNQ